MYETFFLLLLLLMVLLVFGNAMFKRRKKRDLLVVWVMEKKRGLKKEDCQKSPAMVRKWKKKTCEREKERERERGPLQQCGISRPERERTESFEIFNHRDGFKDSFSLKTRDKL